MNFAVLETTNYSRTKSATATITEARSSIGGRNILSTYTNSTSISFSSSPRFVYLAAAAAIIASNSFLPLSTSLITAHDCLSNSFNSEKAATHLMLMSRNIENSSVRSDCCDDKSNEYKDEEKEEENSKEINKMLLRRESIPEEPTSSKSINKIEESNNSTSSSEVIVFNSENDIQNSDNINTKSSINVPIIENINPITPDTIIEGQEYHTNQSFGSNSDSEPVISFVTIENSPSTSLAATVATSSPNDSPRRKSSISSLKDKLFKSPSNTSSNRGDEDTISKSSDTSGEQLIRQTSVQQQDNTVNAISGTCEKSRSTSRLSERAKKKSWYNVIYPNYKSRAEDFKKLFKEVPTDERLIVDYSCALQRDILLQGRLYVSQNYVCFHANILGWGTYVCLKWKDVTAISKEKTALVIPNAISISTAQERYFFATFTSRDKSFLMLFRIWQNTLMNKPILPQEIWQWVHNCYGDELGLTTDDEDYIDPTTSVQQLESEADFDIISCIDDSGASSVTGTTTDYTTAFNSNNNSSSGGGVGGNSRHTSSASSAAGDSTRKSKSKSSFFNSNKSNLNTTSTAAINNTTTTTTTTTSNSSSDHKASDNNSNSGIDFVMPMATSSKISSNMKSNAKELILTSAKAEDTATAATTSATMNLNGSSGSGVNSNKDNKLTAATAVAAASGSKSTTDGKRKVTKNSRQRDESLSKNSETLPTDVSDSSDSDENKIPFVATAECTSTHEGRQFLHTILPINIDTLFNMLFSKSKFLIDFHAMRKSTDLHFGEWTTNEEGQRVRTVNVTVQLSASVGPKTSKVTEYQVMRDCSKPNELYSIDINSVNAGIPYADSFSVLLHYCLVRTVDDHTMLSVHAQIKYKKSVWGVVKGFIEKNTWAGLEDFFTSQLRTLQSETCIPPAKGKGRRPRRGTTTQIRPIEEAPTAQAKPCEPAENVLITHTLTPHLPINIQTVAKEPQNKYTKWLSMFVIMLLCFLIALNVILLLKLWKLEGRIEEDLTIRTRMTNLAQLKQLPSTEKDWIELMHQQEMLHETELRKWHKVLQTAIELLKKTEKTLAELMFR